MFRKTPHKQTCFVPPKRKEKQIDYILTQRRYLRNVKDPEANDMIHMVSDHRSKKDTTKLFTLSKKQPPEKETKYMTQEIKSLQQTMKARFQKPKHKGPKEKAWRTAAQ